VCRACVDEDRNRFRKLAKDQPGGLLFAAAEVEGDRCSLCRKALPDPPDLAELRTGTGTGAGDDPHAGDDPPGLSPIR